MVIFCGVGMKILVIGASQGTGALCVKEALARGHEVTAFARNPDKIGIDDPKLKKMKGDFHQRQSVLDAVKGHDAVIITASATSLDAFKIEPNYFSKGTAFAVEGLSGTAVRLVILSSMGTGESRKLIPFYLRPFILDWMLRLPFADHNRQEQLVMASNTKWVIARPGRLTDGPAQRSYQKKAAIEKVPAGISRADVADFLVEAATTDTWIGKAVQLGG